MFSLVVTFPVSKTGCILMFYLIAGIPIHKWTHFPQNEMLLTTKIDSRVLLCLFKIVTETSQNHKHTPGCAIFSFYVFLILLHIFIQDRFIQSYLSLNYWNICNVFYQDGTHKSALDLILSFTLMLSQKSGFGLSFQSKIKREKK